LRERRHEEADEHEGDEGEEGDEENRRLVRLLIGGGMLRRQRLRRMLLSQIL
jgi:hypothetical protein